MRTVQMVLGMPRLRNPPTDGGALAMIVRLEEGSLAIHGGEVTERLERPRLAGWWEKNLRGIICCGMT